jgi:xylulokinase
VSLIIVLGHERCGAVRAALDLVKSLPSSDPLAGKGDFTHVGLTAHSFGTYSGWAVGGASFDAAAVRGIGVSGQQHGCVVLDARGAVVRPAKLWCDTTTTAECAEITQALGGAKGAIRAVGNAVLPGFTAPKILWLRKNEPENYARLATVLLPHDYLNWWLTGGMFMEFGDASGSALMDVRKRRWSEAAIQAIDPELSGKLPTLSSSDQPAGQLLGIIAEATIGYPGNPSQ